jgi:hypothetical protein
VGFEGAQGKIRSDDPSILSNVETQLQQKAAAQGVAAASQIPDSAQLMLGFTSTHIQTATPPRRRRPRQLQPAAAQGHAGARP